MGDGRDRAGLPGWQLTLGLVASLSACGGDPCASPSTSLPSPRLVEEDGRACVATRAVCIESGTDDEQRLLETAVREAGLQVGGRCDWILGVARTLDLLPASAASTLAASTSPERFALLTTVEGDQRTAHTTLIVPDGRALRHAVRTALARRRHGHVVAGTVVDAPSFATRGLVEGFYGDPYTVEQRRTTLGLMARLGMNAYLYGPKGDVFVHQMWRQPYGQVGAAALSALTDDARALGIEPIWAVSPAPNAFFSDKPETSIQFSSERDRASLFAKLGAMRSLGFARFALFLDDTAPELYWLGDRLAYKSVAEAHAALANAMLAHLRTLDPDARLWFVGRDYSELQTTWLEYNVELAATLADGVDVMWTGPEIYSKRISVADCNRINDVLGRRVTIWDNAPEQLAPITGRTADLPRATDVFFSNPVMNEWRYFSVAAFWHALGPIGLYQWNPAKYEEQAAFDWWQQQPIHVPH